MQHHDDDSFSTFILPHVNQCKLANNTRNSIMHVNTVCESIILFNILLLK